MSLPLGEWWRALLKYVHISLGNVLVSYVTTGLQYLCCIIKIAKLYAEAREYWQCLQIGEYNDG